MFEREETMVSPTPKCFLVIYLVGWRCPLISPDCAAAGAPVRLPGMCNVPHRPPVWAPLHSFA